MKLKELKSLYESGKNPLAYIPYAEALRHSGYLSQALEVCKNGLLKDVSSVTGLSLLARILYDMGRYDDALEELGNVLQMAHDAFGANFLMAKILSKKRDYRDAMDIVQSVKKMNPTDAELLKFEKFLQSQILYGETQGDFKQRRSSRKKSSLDARVNELLKHLRALPGIIRFSFTPMPDQSEEDKEDIDPARIYFSMLNRITKEQKVGALKRIIVEMDKASLLMFHMNGSLIKIVTKPTVNLGKLRLHVENLLNP